MKTLEKIFDIFSRVMEKNRYLVVGIILLFIFLLDYFLIMKPQLGLLNSVNPKLTILEQDIKELRGNIPKINVYQKEINQLKEQFQKTGYRIPYKEEVSLILEGISRLANQNKIKIEQMMPVKGAQELLLKSNEGKYYSFSIFVDVEGSYHDIGRFVNKIEKDDIFKSISALSITANPKDAVHHSVKMTIKAIILEKTEPQRQGQKGS